MDEYTMTHSGEELDQAISSSLSLDQKFVRSDRSQSLTDTQKDTARTNINAGKSGPTRNLWLWGDKVFDGTQQHIGISNINLPVGTYTLSAEIETPGGTEFNVGMHFYHEGVAIANLIASPFITANKGRQSVAFTLSDSADIVLVLNSVSEITTYAVSWKNIQLEEGDVATPYVPPISGIDDVARADINSLTTITDSLTETTNSLATTIDTSYDIIDGTYLTFEAGAILTPARGTIASLDRDTSKTTIMSAVAEVTPGQIVYLLCGGSTSYRSYALLNDEYKVIYISLTTYQKRKIIVRENAKYLIVNNLIRDYPEYYAVISDSTKFPDSETINSLNVGMFNRIGVCGYSWESGYFYTPSGNQYTRRDNSWGAVLADMYGLDYSCYGVPSGTTCAPNSSHIGENGAVCWQSDSFGLPKLLSESPCDFYWINFFKNDSAKLRIPYIGSIDDLHEDYTENPDTYYGNFGRIMDQILQHAPNAKFVFSYKQSTADEIDAAYKIALEEIAQHYGVPTIAWYDDFWFFNWLGTNANLIQNHPTIVDYTGIAKAADRLLSICMRNNWEYFNDFIPSASVTRTDSTVSRKNRPADAFVTGMEISKSDEINFGTPIDTPFELGEINSAGELIDFPTKSRIRSVDYIPYNENLMVINKTLGGTGYGVRGYILLYDEEYNLIPRSVAYEDLGSNHKIYSFYNLKSYNPAYFKYSLILTVYPLTDVMMYNITKNFLTVDSSTGIMEIYNDDSDVNKGSSKILFDYNSLNIVDLMSKANSYTTSNGITFTYNSDGSCTISGTKTNDSVAFHNFFIYKKDLPNYIVPGKTYYISYSSTNVDLMMYKYVDGSLISGSFLRTKEDCEVQIPVDATGIIIRYAVYGDTGLEINETVHPIILTAPSNIELATKYKNFNVAMFGDSIMLGRDGNSSPPNITYAKKNIPYCLSYLSGWSVDNLGVGSMGWCATTSSGNAYTKISNTDLSKYDVIVLCYGVNDTKYQLGTWDSDDESTICGQIRKCINYISITNNKAKIILVAPFNTRSGEFPNWRYSVRNNGSSSLGIWSRQDLSDALARIADYYGLSFISQKTSPLWGYGIGLPDGTATYQYLSPDDVHPNPDGYKALGHWLSAKILAEIR